jgi:hypothetical protein
MRNVLVILLGILLAGCYPPAPSPNPAPPASPHGEAGYLPKTALAAEPERPVETAVDSALAWSEKYTQAVERLLKTQQENRALLEENRQLAAQAAKLQAELDQLRKELTDANAMLMEMRQALENWKRDVLGFRGEIRAAQGAQMDALSKVLRLLGGEVQAPTTRPAGQTSAGAPGEGDASRETGG